MTGDSLREHAAYLADTARCDAYERALRSLLECGTKSVLDLGAGSGILGLMSARAGARVVYAVEAGSIGGAAADAALRSMLADRIVFLKGLSTETELPERVDVAVCDQIGGFVYDAGVLECFADARRRLMAPDGVLVPAGFRLFVAPAECEVVREQISLWASSPSGFDFSSFHDLAVNTEHRVDATDVRVLGTPVQVSKFRSDHVDPIVGKGSSTIEVAGGWDGLVGWFEADMGASITLTNRPGDPDRISRWCTFYPIDGRLQVRQGDLIEAHIDLRPKLNAVTWHVRLVAPDGTSVAKERHSTLLGKFLDDDDLARATGAAVSTTGLGHLVTRMLELADGARSSDEVIARLREEHPNRLASATVERTLRKTLRRFSRIS